MKSSKIKVSNITMEFIWTFVLTFAVLASINGFIGGATTPVVAGAVVFAGVLAAGAISGAHFNPAVTIAMFTAKKINITNAVAYILMQLVAGFVAYAAMAVLLLDEVPVVLESGRLWDSSIVLAEIFGTAVFMFGLATAVGNKYKDVALSALIATSLVIGIFFASTAGSLGVLNPAVAIGLGVVTASYVVGPIVGAIIGINLHLRLVANKK